MRNPLIAIIAIGLIASAAFAAKTPEVRERVAIALGNGEMEYAPIDPDSPKQPQAGVTTSGLELIGSTDADLRRIPKSPKKDPRPAREMGAPAQSMGSGTDKALQTSTTTQALGTSPSAYDGLSLGANGAGWPPDTTGAIGPSHFIQAVNTSIGIYDRATGAKAGTTLGSGLQSTTLNFDDFFKSGTTRTNTPCDSNNQGDPLVLFDAIAQRWIVSDFAWASSGGYYQCIAVSKGTNPVTGGWNFYGLLASSSALNDYPKMGVWHNGIWMTANMFKNGRTYSNAQVWVFNREDLMAGVTKPRSFTWNMGSSQFSLLPSNLSDLSSTSSDSGWTNRPAYALSSYNTAGLKLWTFPLNWSATSQAAPTLYNVSGVSTYTKASGRVPQGNGGEGLDALGDRLMYPLQYRNGSLWAAHSVAPASGRFGVRWWQIGTLPTNSSAATPSITQQGTWSPDSTLQRWMPSIAINKKGEMALIYSTSSSTTDPSIAMTGRTASAAVNTLDVTETTLKTGTGVQINGYNRWGDYSMVAVDPTDSCTFWYTTEYYKANGRDWQTAWGSFRISSCP